MRPAPFSQVYFDAIKTRLSDQIQRRQVNISDQEKMASPAEKLDLRGDIDRAIELLRKLQAAAPAAQDPLTAQQQQKYRQLHQILSSPLFGSVREVYERVYDTVQIHGSPDIRASATAKATIAVFSAAEQHTQPRQVELPKTDEGKPVSFI